MSQFTPVLSEGVFSLGGYTSFLPDAWDRYLKHAIRSRHPGYFFRHLLARTQRKSEEANDCILVSLREYILDQFGILLPSETLFSVYNEDGLGILPGKIIEAISAVIEPLGLEVEWVVVPDLVLSRALGCPGKILTPERYSELHNIPGLCMINIDQGHSHAFYWKAIDARKFKSEKFRLAITIHRKDGASANFSVLDSLEAYSHMLKEFASGRNGRQALCGLANELDCIVMIARGGFDDCPEAQAGFRQQIAQKMVGIRQHLPPSRGGKKENQSILCASDMVDRIIREVKVIA